MALPRVVRTTIFWMHLSTALVAGLVIMIMAATGIVIAYEQQLIEWANGYTIVSAGKSRVPVETLLANAGAVADPAVTPPAGQRSAEPRPEGRGGASNAAMITISADESAPAVVRFGRAKTLYLDPYTGAVLGEGSKKAHDFFHFVEEIHRWLGQTPQRNEGGQRNGPGMGQSATAATKPLITGKSITGASNLCFLFLLISGIFIWLPRRWTWKTVRPVVVPSTRLKGKARDFNWHNSLGFIFAPLLLITILSGTFMAYQWPSKLVNSAFGFPERQEGAPRDGGGGNGERPRDADRRQRDGGERRIDHGAEPNVPSRANRNATGGRSPVLPVGTVNALWDRAERQTPNWKTISFRAPTARDKSVAFTVDVGNGRPDHRGRLELDTRTADVLKWTAPGTSGQLFSASYRQWMKPIHTGTVLGVFGQTIAMLVALTVLVLVYTGFALSWRRFWAWRARKRREAVGESVLAEAA
jgi:uncharacterized iron-regulated membrane protein